MPCGTDFPTAWAEVRCLWCDTLLPVERDPRRLFCSRACLVAHHNDKRSARLLLARMDRSCAECGASFTGRDSRKIYCSRACAVKACNRRKRGAAAGG